MSYSGVRNLRESLSFLPFPSRLALDALEDANEDRKGGGITKKYQSVPNVSDSQNQMNACSSMQLKERIIDTSQLFSRGKKRVTTKREIFSSEAAGSA